MIYLVFVVLLFASPAQAAVIWSQNWESFADGDTCTQIESGDPDITLCRGTTTGTNTSLITIENAIPGFAGSFPSGTKVMRSFVDAQTVQQDTAIGIGDGASAAYDNYIPASVWIQFAWFINNGSGEVTSTQGRAAKILYPCRSIYPCNDMYWMIQAGPNNSYAPDCSSDLGAETDGDMYLVMREADGATVSHASAACGGSPDTKLGHTSRADWIKPGRWNIVKCHMDTSSTSAGIDCWVANKGEAFTQILNWHNGSTVAGNVVTYTVPSAGGHRSLVIPSTQPANNPGSLPITHYWYFDDIYVATSESDLPAYGSATKHQLTGGSRLTGTWRMQ